MLVFTEHAEFVAAERNIFREWFCAPIREFGDRVLRVMVNTRVAPWRVVSEFFDRPMEGKR